MELENIFPVATEEQLAQGFVVGLRGSFAVLRKFTCGHCGALWTATRPLNIDKPAICPVCGTVHDGRVHAGPRPAGDAADLLALLSSLRPPE